LAGSAEDQKRLLLEEIDCAACAGVDWIQIREKDLSGRELMSLICEAVKRVPSHCRILVNDRLDVAIAADAAGVHLGEQSIPAAQAKRLANERKGAREFLVGVSAHSLQSVREAEQNGSDYVIFGPVFATPSKVTFGSPQGLNQLEQVCRSVSVPVLAIGGITLENARECAAAGAAGIAAIRLFREAGDLRTVVQALRGPLK
jgi:thiamine-phosphate pyrophosphorylase